MCKCKNYDPEGEGLTGYRCYVCNSGITASQNKEHNGKHFCSQSCFDWWYNR